MTTPAAALDASISRNRRRRRRGQIDKAPMTMPIALGLVDPRRAASRARLERRERRRTAPGRFRAGDAARRDRSSPAWRAARRCRCCADFRRRCGVDDDLTEADLLILLRARQRQFQPLAGGAEPWRRDCCLRAVAAIRARAARRRRFDAGVSSPPMARSSPTRCAGAHRPRASPRWRLTCPSEADIAREMARNVDPDAIFAARESLRGALGRAHAAALVAAARQPWPTRRVSAPDAASAGRRALRNVALAMFAAGERRGGRAARPTATGRGRQHDRAVRRAGGALVAAGRARARTRSRLSRARHAADPLILDKWFSLQAQIPEAGTLDARARADAPSRLSRCAIPTACGR